MSAVDNAITFGREQILAFTQFGHPQGILRVHGAVFLVGQRPFIVKKESCGVFEDEFHLLTAWGEPLVIDNIVGIDCGMDVSYSGPEGVEGLFDCCLGVAGADRIPVNNGV